MDAACMDGQSGAFGAVAAIERVKNPVLVARKVMDTPHILIVGEGVTRDEKGHFAAAISTGGTTITFYGRVGDVPMYGAGIYAGPMGAAACTGNGEDIVKHLVAKATYDLLARGYSAQKAVDRILAAFPATIDLGLVAIGPTRTALRPLPCLGNPLPSTQPLSITWTRS